MRSRQTSSKPEHHSVDQEWTIDSSSPAACCCNGREFDELSITTCGMAGRKSMSIEPDELYELIIRHEEAQRAERDYAGSEWHEGGWMFTQPNGRPIDPRQDWGEWKSILVEAEVRDARLHDARHTAATVLLLLGVNDRVVMEIMGWSTPTMKQRYMHLTDQLRSDVAELINAYFWKVT
jgi:hypothetical protein